MSRLLMASLIDICTDYSEHFYTLHEHLSSKQTLMRQRHVETSFNVTCYGFTYWKWDLAMAYLWTPNANDIVCVLKLQKFRMLDFPGFILKNNIFLSECFPSTVEISPVDLQNQFLAKWLWNLICESQYWTWLGRITAFQFDHPS